MKMKRIGYNFIPFDKVGQRSVGIWNGISPGKGKGIGKVLTKYGVDRFSITTDMAILENLPHGRYVEIELTGFDESSPGPNKMKLLDIQIDEDQGGLEISPDDQVSKPEPVDAEVPEEAPF